MFSLVLDQLQKTYKYFFNYTPIHIVGNVTHDILINKNKTQCLGGSSAYISNIMSGLDISYKVVSKVGADFKYLSQCAFTPKIIKNRGTTTFINITKNSPRSQKVIEICEHISPEDIDFFSDISILCGVIGEIPFETVKKIRRQSKLLIGDIQGFIRKVSLNNNIYSTHIKNYEALLMLDFLKLSEEELNYCDIKKLIKVGITVIVTCAERGCYIYKNNAVTYVKTLSGSLVDDTGAGDSFLAGFSAGLSNNLSVYESVVFGHRCAYETIKFVGIPPKSSFSPLKGLLNRQSHQKEI